MIIFVNLNNHLSIIKYIFTIILYSNTLFIDFIYINIEKRESIQIDNEFKYNLYEKEKIFIKSKKRFKAIALYYPEYNNISFYKYFNNSKNRKIIDADNIKKLLKAQIQLAKRHKIYGFAIIFDLFTHNHYSQISINEFLNTIRFPFFLIWKNDEFRNIHENIANILFDYLKKFMISENYIKIKEKPVLSIKNPNKNVNIINLCLNLRKKARKEIGEIFIIYPFTGNFRRKLVLREFDAIYDFSKIDLLENPKKSHNIFHYSGYIYKNLCLNKLNFDFPLFRTCYVNYRKFKDFTPEKFYISNKLIFKWENINFHQNEGFIFVDSWNDYQNSNYLEPDEIYGYALINSFTKSILNLPFQENKIILSNIRTIIAIQIHAFYEDIFTEIINKVNLIPVKYDLFISTNSEEKKEFIKRCLMNTTANKYKIQIFENKGRDVYPFIRQMEREYKNYKYICHIHTKKSFHKLLLGRNWREYIYNNLIGNKEIISEILYDFEKHKKLGFIFPEFYYYITKQIANFENINIILNNENKKYMNLILKKFFRKFKIKEKLNFPAGNMFWAKTKAIFQIFHIRLKYPEEANQTNNTIMHAIERIWLYLVKLNGYYYRTLFKYY